LLVIEYFLAIPLKIAKRSERETKDLGQPKPTEDQIIDKEL